MCPLLCLASFLSHSAFEIHPGCACLSGSLFVAESLAWTCHHLLRSICLWTFGLFPSLVIMSKADTDIQGQSSVWT